jgi:hypothetical protein
LNHLIPFPLLKDCKISKKINWFQEKPSRNVIIEEKPYEKIEKKA